MFATSIVSVPVYIEHSCDKLFLSLLRNNAMRKKSSLFLVVLLSWYTVFGQHCKPKDCIDLKCYRVSTADGGAMIYPESISFTKLEVTCKQTGDGGGWIVYLRRFDGSVAFNRTWADYKGGFGEQGESKESWLGNENVYQLIKSFASKGGGAQLRIEGYAFNGSSCVTTLDKFVLMDETNKYRLQFADGVSTMRGGIKDWEYSRDTWFLTTDNSYEHFCFKQFSGGWWYGTCHRAYFTGKYPKDKTTITDNFYIRKFEMPLKAADMLVRQTMAVRTCNNPCKNGGTCEYIEDIDNHRCVCPKTHCGPKCASSNPCGETNGTCVYSPDSKDVSCVNTVNTVPGGTVMPLSSVSTTLVVGGIVVSCLLVVLVGAIVTWIIMGKEQQRLAREEEERERLLAEEGGYFAYLFS